MYNGIKKMLNIFARKEESMYLIVISVIISSMILANTVLVEKSVLGIAPIISQILEIIRYVMYLLLLIKIGIDIVLNKVQFLRVILIFLITIYIVFTVKNFEIFIYTLILVASVNIDFKKIIKTVFKVQVVLIFLIIFLSAFNILPNIIYDVGLRNRESLGFTWTTIPSLLYFFIMTEYIYLKGKKLELKDFVYLETINTFFFILTDTRFVFIVGTLLLICVWLNNTFYFFSNILYKSLVKKLIISLPFVLFVISVLITYFYNSDVHIMNKLDSILSGRLALGNQGFKNFGITIFGQEIEWVGFGLNYDGSKVYNFVDSSYLNILFNYGVIFTILVMIAYSFILSKGLRTGDNYLIICISIILIFSFTEPRLINFMYHPFLLICSPLFVKERNQDECII